MTQGYNVKHPTEYDHALELTTAAYSFIHHVDQQLNTFGNARLPDRTEGFCKGLADLKQILHYGEEPSPSATPEDYEETAELASSPLAALLSDWAILAQQLRLEPYATTIEEAVARDIEQEQVIREGEAVLDAGRDILFLLYNEGALSGSDEEEVGRARQEYLFIEELMSSVVNTSAPLKYEFIHDLLKRISAMYGTSDFLNFPLETHLGSDIGDISTIFDQDSHGELPARVSNGVKLAMVAYLGRKDQAIRKKLSEIYSRRQRGA